MKIFTDVGSKKRLVEMFNGVNKININENSVGNSIDRMNQYFIDLVNRKVNVTSVNNQVDGDKHLLKLNSNLMVRILVLNLK